MKILKWIKIFLIFLIHIPLIFSYATPDGNSYAPLKSFAESLTLIEEHYPEKPDRHQLISGAIRGMLFELDPYSHFMSREQTENFRRQNKSHYGGIGIEVGFRNQRIIVVSVFKNSGAFNKGVKVGDVITHVNGKSIENLPFESAIQKIKGKIGTTLTLTILREKVKKPILFSIPFSRIHVPSVTGEEINKYFFYVKITSFRDSTFKELKKILKVKQCSSKKEKKLCSRIRRGLLLDLRQNAGGMIDPALLIADLFIPDGILISTKGRTENRTFYAKKIGTLLHPFPILVLIDQYSASASEILTASLKENNRAITVGQTSFGKGSIQSIFNLDHGNTLKLTVAHYYTPQGNVIESKGIPPDIEIQPYTSLTKNSYDKKIMDFKTRFYRQYSFQQDDKSYSLEKNPKWIKMEEDPYLKQAVALLFSLFEQ